MVRSMRSLILACISSLFLVVAGPLLAGAAVASDFLSAPSWPAERSVALDAIGHVAMLEGADPGQVRTIAFVDRASTHDLFSAGGFALNHFGVRC